MHEAMDAPRAPKSVMIIAGDASGDLHGSKLVQAMRKKDETLYFFGIGGHALRAAGVKILVDTSTLSVIGVTEIFSNLPTFLNAMMLAKTLLKKFQPDLLILIDFPGFNLPVSGIAKRYHVRVLYYISPQVWAWRQGRVKKMRKRIDHMAVILPFEAEFFRRHKVPVTFVGHPLLDVGHCWNDPTSPSFETEKNETLNIGLLPGSRDQEITRLLPVMLDAATILSKRAGDIRFFISVAATVERKTIEAIIQRHAAQLDCTLVSGSVDKVFKQCRLSVVAPGTVTLEAAICGMPMVIIYKVSPVTYWLGRVLVHVKHIGLVNLIAGKEMVPELIQGDASGDNIADTVLRLLDDAQNIGILIRNLSSIREKLGGPGASERTAEIALNML